MAAGDHCDEPPPGLLRRGRASSERSRRRFPPEARTGTPPAAVAVDPFLVTIPSWWVTLDAWSPAVMAGPMAAKPGGGRSTQLTHARPNRSGSTYATNMAAVVCGVAAAIAACAEQRCPDHDGCYRPHPPGPAQHPPGWATADSGRPLRRIRTLSHKAAIRRPRPAPPGTIAEHRGRVGQAGAVTSTESRPGSRSGPHRSRRRAPTRAGRSASPAITPGVCSRSGRSDTSRSGCSCTWAWWSSPSWCRCSSPPSCIRSSPSFAGGAWHAGRPPWRRS